MSQLPTCRVPAFVVQRLGCFLNDTGSQDQLLWEEEGIGLVVNAKALHTTGLRASCTVLRSARCKATKHMLQMKGQSWIRNSNKKRGKRQYSSTLVYHRRLPYNYVPYRYVIDT